MLNKVLAICAVLAAMGMKDIIEKGNKSMISG